MRRIFITCGLISLLAVPAVAGGAVRATGDGTLDVKDGYGVVQVRAKGGVIGRLYVGTLTVRDPIPDDNVQEVVTGYDNVPQHLNDFVTVYTGKNIRFRFIGGNFKITVRGSDIDLSAVGKGKVLLQGFGGTENDNGTYSFNDELSQPLPLGLGREFNLGSPTGTTT